MTTPVLEVRDLVTVFHTDAGPVRAVDGVSFTVAKGETLGIVGESGSGKSVTAQSIMRLLDPPARIEGGQVLFEGRDVLAMSGRELTAWRGANAAMVFQDSLTGLNPVLRILRQVSEHVIAHGRMNTRDARRHGIALMRRMGVASPERAAASFPHQFSGGMRQRVMIAIGMANDPLLLLADEPTTALDVTIQAQILDLLRDLQTELGMSVILITHDMGVIAEFARRVMVMYAGRVVETAPVGALFRRPVHPYTDGLLAAIPKLDVDVRRLPAIPGSIPDPTAVIPGCRYSPRCPQVQPACRRDAPDLVPAGPEREARCPPRVAAL